VATGARIGTGFARQPRKRVIAIGSAIVALTAGAGTYVLTQGGGSTPANAPISPGVTLPGPFRVTSMTPAPGDRKADGSDPVHVTFSAPVSARSAQHTLSPSVPGRWQATGDTLMFTPTVPFGPPTRVTVTVPAGVRSDRGSLLAKPMTAQFTTETFSGLALADLLGQLGYLPGSWRVPNLGLQVVSKLGSAGSGLAAALQLAYDPPPGTMTLEQGYPASLARLWNPGTYNVIIRGAVMAFQSEHTGIPSEPTVDGSFPVYLRFLNTIMSGTNPDGSHYSDPVQYVSYFNGGDAVHYFPRGGYGFEQSLGCVELSYGDAKKAYPFLTYGSLVTVSG